MSRHYKKYIRIPPGESVDIRDILPIVSHPRFQRLLFVAQLGTTLRVFPGASHNRFEHALGVYAKTLRFCQKMFKEGSLTEREAKTVPLFGLLHDIGHGPFSHLIEELTPYDHDENGLHVIDEMKKEIIASGGDFNLIKRMFARKSPLYRIVMDRNLGMDKLDYLDRDTFHTGFGQRPDVESVFDYLTWLKNQLVIDKKDLEAAKQMQRLYLYMYKEVYLHKSSLISQRFLQKMISIYLSHHRIDPEDLWALSDGELMAKIYTDTDLRLQFLYSSYMKRMLPSTGLVFRMEQKLNRERVAGKEIKVIGMPPDFFDNLTKRSSPTDLSLLEEEIAKALAVPAYTVLVVPILAPWRFAPQDILYHDEGKIFSLKETQPEYFNSMRAELEEYLAVRVCIIGNRRLLYTHAAKISAVIEAFITRRKQPANLILKM
ncbi:MAG TPA: HD domain-containing protein [Candidatus Paceibacterota bacterium]|nr:HD domain-containing protein [Candidatus Paceibacterota bacterium]